MLINTSSARLIQLYMNYMLGTPLSLFMQQTLLQDFSLKSSIFVIFDVISQATLDNVSTKGYTNVTKNKEIVFSFTICSNSHIHIYIHVWVCGFVVFYLFIYICICLYVSICLYKCAYIYWHLLPHCSIDNKREFDWLPATTKRCANWQ